MKSAVSTSLNNAYDNGKLAGLRKLAAGTNDLYYAVVETTHDEEGGSKKQYTERVGKGSVRVEGPPINTRRLSFANTFRVSQAGVVKVRVMVAHGGAIKMGVEVKDLEVFSSSVTVSFNDNDGVMSGSGSWDGGEVVCSGFRRPSDTVGGEGWTITKPRTGEGWRCLERSFCVPLKGEGGGD